MSGRDILAVLAMIAPSFTLIVAIAFALAPTERLMASAEPAAQGPQAAKVQVATQKRMHDPWANTTPAKYSKVAQTARCKSTS